MRFVANREELHRGFQRVGNVVSAGIQQPIYRNVKVVAAGDGVTLSATDLEVGLSLKVADVQIEQEGAALLPHARVAPVLGATPDETVALAEDDGAVTIETADSDFRILGEDPEDFPGIPELPEDGAFEIDPAVLRYAVRRTVFATVEEKGRYALNGVYFVIGEDGTLELVAADGARLAHVKKKVSNPGEAKTNFIVMARGVDQLARLADYGTDAIQFAVTERQFIAQNDAGRMACQLVEGQFPNYQEVIPADSRIKATLPVRELLSAVRRASFLTTDETRVVDFCFAPGTLSIRSESPDVGRAEVRVPVDYEGEEARIAFDPGFVEDMLKVVERESVKMRFTDRRSPCVMKAGVDYTYVISPIIREEGEL